MIIGLLGLGEVGHQYGIGMVRNGAVVKGWDIRFNDPASMLLFDRSKEGGVVFTETAPELIESSDIIMANTTSHVAVSTAEMAKPFLKPGQIYIDGNSAIPAVKREIDALLKDTGCHFVDGVTMNSPPQLGVKCPVAVSGPMAQKAADILNSYGMNVTCLGDQIGQASALKVTRSIFTKSLISAFMESMLMAHKYGISPTLFESIVEYLSDPPADTLETIVKTNVILALRQGQEVESVSLMEQGEGMDNTMAAAAAKKLYYLSSMGMREKFHDKAATDMVAVLDEMLKACQKKD